MSKKTLTKCILYEQTLHKWIHILYITIKILCLKFSEKTHKMLILKQYLHEI